MKKPRSNQPFKKSQRGTGLSFGDKQFKRPQKGGKLQAQDFAGYGRLSPRNAILLALAIAIPYLAIALAIAFTVSTTVAAVICIPFFSVIIIAGLMYWLGGMNI